MCACTRTAVLPCRVKDAEHCSLIEQTYSLEYINLSLQRLAHGSRINGSSVGFGTMCAFNTGTLGKSDLEINQSIHKRMLDASKHGRWNEYLSLQQQLR